ncbi:hypothetical protein EVAR_3683_1 [Eumeta japonica]|uniref:Uncharacterized protein n=1 Tax=Eumeta variegata TaxID=151549 RepID=A0A4C1STU1_EUMVA|nr:hypothetical protein EVAR_3683_1 [Eumeta japonica]
MFYLFCVMAPPQSTQTKESDNSQKRLSVVEEFTELVCYEMNGNVSRTSGAEVETRVSAGIGGQGRRVAAARRRVRTPPVVAADTARYAAGTAV